MIFRLEEEGVDHPEPSNLSGWKVVVMHDKLSLARHIYDTLEEIKQTESLRKSGLSGLSALPQCTKIQATLSEYGAHHESYTWNLRENRPEPFHDECLVISSYSLTTNDIRKWHDLHFAAVHSDGALQIIVSLSDQNPEQHKKAEVKTEQGEIGNITSHNKIMEATLNITADDDDEQPIYVPVAFHLKNMSTSRSFPIPMSSGRKALCIYESGDNWSICERVHDTLQAVKRSKSLSNYGVNANGCYLIEAKLRGRYEDGLSADKDYAWELFTTDARSEGDDDLTHMSDYVMTPQEMTEWEELHTRLCWMHSTKCLEITFKFAGKIDLIAEPAIEEEEEPLDLALRNYFDWLKSRVKTKRWRDDLEEAWEIVDEERLCIRQLKLCTRSKLVTLGILEGIAALVIDEISAWEKYRTVVKWRGKKPANGTKVY